MDARIGVYLIPPTGCCRWSLITVDRTDLPELGLPVIESICCSPFKNRVSSLLVRLLVRVTKTLSRRSRSRAAPAGPLSVADLREK
jgi:hypothetical protein